MPGKENRSTILIVDDIPSNRDVLGSLLSYAYDLEMANNGKVALEMLENDSSPDLILLDIMMPELDGFSVCRQIREKPALQHIPIIFLTSKDDIDSVVQGFEAGGQDYVTKPFRAKELLSRIQTHLELKASREKLELMNQDLEKKVQERTEQLSQANEKLSVLENTKNNFLNLIAHELRTPLTGIVSVIPMIQVDTLSSDQKQLIGIVKDSADRLLAFSETALLITSIKSNIYKTSKSLMSLKKSLTLVVEKKTASTTSKEVSWNITEFQDDAFIDADQELIINVFEAVIDNAVKVSPAKGTISITCSDKDNKYILQFCDNGDGFSDTVLPVLFEFFVDDVEYHTKGLGLGLARAKLILDLYKGTITGKNRPEGGACVEITLPKEV